MRQQKADERLEVLLLERLDTGDGIGVAPEFWQDLKGEALGLAGERTERARGCLVEHEDGPRTF